MKTEELIEDECVAHGGHFWKHWSGNDVVDRKTFEIDNSFGSKCMYYPNGEPKYRGCPLCGREEVLKPAQWVQYDPEAIFKHLRGKDE